MTGTDGSLHGASKLGLAALPGRLFAFLGQPPPFSQLPEPRGPVDPTLRCSASALPGRESDPDTRGWLVVQQCPAAGQADQGSCDGDCVGCSSITA
jgi:hypothetical protein